MSILSHRHVLFTDLGLTSAETLSACGTRDTPTAAPVASNSPLTVPSQTPLVIAPGTKTVNHVLTPRPVTLDLDGITARTWAYDKTLDAPVLRVRAGDLLQARIENKLPTSTSTHWHGIALRQPSDGVPGVTQQPTKAGSSFTHQFVAPDPGVYFFHPHTGVQIDRGLHWPLVIDDPAEPGRYDHEWITALDNWADGMDTSPDDILAAFKAQSGTMSGGMNHDMDGTDHSMSPLGNTGSVTYPHYLVSGRVPAAPHTLTARPGQKVRLHVINASSGTIFKLALQGHRLTVTHTDGFPVTPTQASAVYLAMEERLDATITLGDGVFVLQATPESKKDTPARTIVRADSGNVPTPDTRIAKLDGKALLTTQLKPVDNARLSDYKPDITLGVVLDDQMRPYTWGLNGKCFGEGTPLALSRGQCVRLRMTDMMMIAHPMRIHGHTWALPGSSGLREDTILVRPMETVETDLQADNPGTWMLHCHNIYHTELGMITTLRY